MFRAALCSPSGQSIVSIHLVCRWPYDMLVWMELQFHPNLHRQAHKEWHMPDVLIQLTLMMISTTLLETCREMKWIKKKNCGSSWLFKTKAVHVFKYRYCLKTAEDKSRNMSERFLFWTRAVCCSLTCFRFQLHGRITTLYSGFFGAIFKINFSKGNSLIPINCQCPLNASVQIQEADTRSVIRSPIARPNTKKTIRTGGQRGGRAKSARGRCM